MGTKVIKELFLDCLKWESIIKSAVPLHYCFAEIDPAVHYLGMTPENPFIALLPPLTALICSTQVARELRKKMSSVFSPKDHPKMDMIGVEVLRSVKKRKNLVNLTFAELRLEAAEDEVLDIDSLNYIVFKLYQLHDCMLALYVGAGQEHRLQTIAMRVDDFRMDA